MKKISSVTTYFRKKILPVVLILTALIMIVYFILFGFSVRLFIFLSFILLIFTYAWMSSFRKLKEVYLGDNYIEVDKEKIHFQKIVSIKKISSYRYRVIYKSQDTEKAFIYMSDFPPFITPKYIKEMSKNIKE
jgi:hypothetical protein